MYSIIRIILFLLPEESAHKVTLTALNCFARFALAKVFFKQPSDDPVTVMGIRFKNRLGIAAGMDNNGDYIEGLAALGFGHIEIGGVTPVAQTGNPRPRLFRLPKFEAIINRKGFPNKGVDYLCRKLHKKPVNVVIGVNIAKNKDTPLDRAVDDYTYCMQKLNSVADYITVNISSPNTPGLRELQTEQYLDNLLSELKRLQRSLPRYVPLAVKIAPDLNEVELRSLVNSCLKHQMDGIVATNTTLSREGVESDPLAHEAGGLSGKPLTERSLAIAKTIHAQTQGQIPLIGVGGIMSRDDLEARRAAGAELVQVYAGLVYHGIHILR